MKRQVVFAVGCLAVLILAGCDRPTRPSVIIPENPAPMPNFADAGPPPAAQAEPGETDSYEFDFSLPVIGQEGTMALSDLRGKVVVVDIWGTWCPPCREEIPHFIALQEKYGEQGLQIVGVNPAENGSSPEEKQQLVVDFMQKYGMNYPCLYSEPGFESKIPGFRGYPTTVFIDKQGKVRRTVVGLRPAATLESYVTELLGEES